MNENMYKIVRKYKKIIHIFIVCDKHASTMKI